MLSLLSTKKNNQKNKEFKKFSDTRQNTKMEVPLENCRFSYLSEGAE